MPMFAANPSMMCTKHTVLGRFEAAADDGFTAVEFLPPHEHPRATCVANLAWAARQAASSGIDPSIEPINRRDIPGYPPNRQDDAHEIACEIGAPNLKVPMDLYHCQIVEGDVACELRRYLPAGRTGHLQIAAVPGRHEPDPGELHHPHPHLLGVIDELGFEGHLGCEYRPRARTSASLGWWRPYPHHGDTPCES